ncbi:helix-turn-helix domain-containing protein [Celeribacter halophilus]|uniref:helix-turn-helix domain-containing protein n=1 Tax=Celeribacter halophilus TaxID=576117 RepID=UPI003A935320
MKLFQTKQSYESENNNGREQLVSPGEALLETPKELAERVGVSAATVRKLIKAGKIEHVFLSDAKRNPKIPKGAWEAFLEQNTIRPDVPKA